MTVSQLEHGMSHKELVGWIALYEIERAEADRRS